MSWWLGSPIQGLLKTVTTTVIDKRINLSSSCVMYHCPVTSDQLTGAIFSKVQLDVVKAVQIFVQFLGKDRTVDTFSGTVLYATFIYQTQRTS